jgi:hypothetical protein
MAPKEDQKFGTCLKNSKKMKKTQRMAKVKNQGKTRIRNEARDIGFTGFPENNGFDAWALKTKKHPALCEQGA